MGQETEIVATVTGGYNGYPGVMNYLAVDPSFQSKDCGKILVDKRKVKLLDIDCPKINP